MKYENPFYYNYVFTKADCNRKPIRKPWWIGPWLFLHPTYVQINDGLAFFYKVIGSQYYFLYYEPVQLSPKASEVGKIDHTLLKGAT